MKIQTDVDIDVFNREMVVEKLGCIFARIDRNNSYEKHNTGVYFQNIPRDANTNIASIGYKNAVNYGFFKLDILNVNLYENVKSEEHLLKLMSIEPDWELFLNKDITDQLFQLNGHSNILHKFKPTSIEELAMILAIIRPAKAYLQQTSWDEIKREVWCKPVDSSYHFKKAHGTAYSLAIIVNLNLLLGN